MNGVLKCILVIVSLSVSNALIMMSLNVFLRSCMPPCACLSLHNTDMNFPYTTKHLPFHCTIQYGQESPLAFAHISSPCACLSVCLCVCLSLCLSAQCGQKCEIRDCTQMRTASPHYLSCSRGLAGRKAGGGGRGGGRGGGGRGRRRRGGGGGGKFIQGLTP